jgi:hypothetical protein
MSSSTSMKLPLVLATLGSVAAGLVIAGRRQRTWGASDEEAHRPLPGDDLIRDATQNTRAITVRARAADVWPWIVQLGADRGGFYSYDWLENHFGFLTGGPANLGIRSTDEIVPEWQHRRVGDLVAADSRGIGGWYVTTVEPGRALVMLMAAVKHAKPARRDEPPFLEFSWAFVLHERPDATRLIVRERVAVGGPHPIAGRIAATPIGLVSFVMTRRMMIGIKQRAERGLRERTESLERVAAP